jgi:hypothetical protein
MGGAPHWARFKAYMPVCAYEPAASILAAAFERLGEKPLKPYVRKFLGFLGEFLVPITKTRSAFAPSLRV